jgi:ribonuclease D
LAKLYAKKLLEPFLLKNFQVQNKDYTRNPEDKYRKINGYSRLSGSKKAVFRRVFDIREKYAKRCNMPPHNVIHKADLINIVKDPKSIDKLRFTKRLRIDLIQGILHELKKAVEEVPVM